MEHGIYESMYRHEETFWWHRGMRKISDMLLKRFLLSQTNAILDIGCGVGGMFPTLSRYGKVTGIDISSDALRYASARGATVVRGEVEKIPFHDGHFDVVNCHDVLYHRDVHFDERALQECARVLKGDGFLFIREPAFNWLRGRHDELVWTERRYTRKTLEERLERNGFTVLWASYVNCFLFPAALAARCLEKISSPSRDLDVFKPPRVLNSAFTAVLTVEAWLLRFITFSFGLSVVCVAKKRKER